jgi:hypothetical protein
LVEPAGAIKGSYIYTTVRRSSADMDNFRKEIIINSLGEQEFYIKKKSISIGINKINGIILITFAAICFMLFFNEKKDISPLVNEIMKIGIVSLLSLTLLLMINTIRCFLVINKESMVMETFQTIAFFKIMKNLISTNEVKYLALVKFSDKSLYLRGNFIQKILGTYNKFCIYLFRKDNSYERLIGFNNYYEARNVSDIISKFIAIKVNDTTEDEFLDEDHYISSYFRLNAMIEEIKKE